MAVTGPRAAYVLALALLVICSSGIADSPRRPGTAAAEPPAIRRADAIPQGRSARDARTGSNLLAALPLGFEANRGQAGPGIDGTLLNPSQVPDENWLIAGPR